MLIQRPDHIPETLYHGTHADFQAFRDGITWFTPERNETLPQYRADASRPWFIFHATIALSRPADLDDAGVRDVLSSADIDPDQVGQLTENSREVVPLLERHGYDGLAARMGTVRHFAVFHPRQIRILTREVIPADIGP